MAITVTHPFVSNIADDSAAAAAGQIVPSNWNATHSLSGTLDVANGGTGTTTSTGTGSVVLSTGPTFSPDVVISGSSTGNALRITQTGSGNALLIEDEASTDATPIVVNNAGSVIVGSTTQPTVGTVGSHKMTVYGATAADASFLCYRTDVSAGPSNITFGKTRGADPLSSGDIIGRVEAAGRDATTAGGGDERTPAARIEFVADGTPALDSMPGRITFQTTPSGTNAPVERMRIDNAGNVGIGGTGSAITGQTLTVSKNITGATSAMSIRARGQIQSDVTSTASMVATFPSTAAATFTLTHLYHFLASQNTIDAASTVTNQWGIVISSNLTGATNNYGINSAIASGTNRWNLYISGTAPNYLSGALSIGSPASTYGLEINRSLSGGVERYQAFVAGEIQSDVTSIAIGVYVLPTINNSSFTLETYRGFQAGSFNISGAATISNYHGFFAGATTQTNITTAYGYTSNLAASGVSRWNFYAGGTAPNYFAGNSTFNTGLTVNGTTNLSGLTASTALALDASKNVVSVTNTGSGNNVLATLPTLDGVLVRYGTGSAACGVVSPDSTDGIPIRTSFYDQIALSSLVTNQHISFLSDPRTTAASFTLDNHYGFFANGISKGAGSSVTTQYGFYSRSFITAANTNYGFYSGLAASGTSRYNFYAAGTAPNYFGGNTIVSVNDNTNAALRITQLGTANALEIEDSTNPDSTPLVVDASGTFIKGRTSSVSSKYFTTAGTFAAQVHSTTTADSSLGLFNYENIVALPSFLVFNKSKSGTNGTLSAVTNGDSLGVIQFNGADNAATPTFNPAAYISAQVAGTVAYNSIPGRLNFATTAVGEFGAAIKVSITPEGYLGVGASPTLASQLVDLRASNNDLTSDTAVNTLRFTDTDTTTAANQPIGKIEFYNSDAENAAVGAYILSSAVGASGGGTIRFGAAADAGAVAEIARVASTGVTIANSVSIGTAGTVTGSVALNGSTSGTVTVNAAAAAGTWTMTLPTSAGTNGYVLSTDGAGITSWIAQSGGGGVTSFSAGSTGLTPNTATTGAVTLAGTLAVANGGTGVTTSTGTGSVVLSTSPVFSSARIDGTTSFGASNGSTQAAAIVTTIPSSTIAYGFITSGTVGSATTNSFSGLSINTPTANTAFTLNSYYGVNIATGSKGASSTVNSAYGYACSGLTWATNNYVYYSNIADSTGRWSIYFAGTAKSYFEGGIGIGTTTIDVGKIHIGGNLPSSGGASRGISMAATVPLTSTGQTNGYLSLLGTQAASFTASQIFHFNASQGTIGAGSTVTTQTGFAAASTLTGATTNYAFNASIAAATNRWNFYASGTAWNYFAGNTYIAGTGGDQALNINGAVRVGAATTANQTSAGTMDFTGGAMRFLVWGASGTQGNFTWWTGTGALGANQRMTLTGSNNLGLATATFGTSATNTFSIASGTAPTTGVADTVQYYSMDLSAGNTMPAWYTEGTNVGTGTPTANRTIAVNFNGTTYYLLASTTA